MSNLTSLATRYAGRPLLLTPRAAGELADRIRAVDPEAAVRPGRFNALIRGLGRNARRIMAMEDDGDDAPPVPMESRLAYAPLYLGEPEDVGFCWSLKDGVALMQVDKPMLDRGEIFCGEVYHGYDTVLQGLREAMADTRVKAVFIRMATPGGVVAGGLPALSDFVRQNNAKAGGKPIHVFADMACSAGYWSICGADWISAPRVGLIGSIGAVVVHENWSEALKRAGVEITAVQFGASKTDGAWFAALSETARADLQAEIDQIGRDFVGAVVAGRPQLTEAEVLATQAAVFLGHHDDSARSALDLKLIDAHATEEEAFNALRDDVAASPVGVALNPVPGSDPSAVGARDRAATSPAKEAPVANKTKAGGKPSAPSALAKAEAAARRAQAEVARLSAEADQDGDEDETDVDAAEGDEDQDDADASIGGDEDDEDGEQTEAQKIAGSAEAAANPKAATAAIASGMTFAQFKGQARAQGGGSRRLAGVMAGSQRLGADAKGGGGKSEGLDPAAIYKRRATRSRPQST